MSGGRIAIRGFDYQGIVALDLLFDHFDHHGTHARMRPEGVDDIDLIWSQDGTDRHCYVQVKKPRETTSGLARDEPWSLNDIAVELLPNTLRQLAGTSSRQVWILGDRIQPQVDRLVIAGTNAATAEPELYWDAVHLLARATVGNDIDSANRAALMRWRFRTACAQRRECQDRLVVQYGQALRDAGVAPDVVLRYQNQVAWSDQHLPDVLSRIEIRPAYGAEAEVGQRFRDRLQREYGMPANVVEDSLFGSLRSYINDVSADPAGLIDRTGFEVQLRSAWPQMCGATEPPVPLPDAIERPDLRDSLIRPDSAMVTEVIGISGSGKTTLAGQAASALVDREPDRLVVYARVGSNAAFRDVLSGVAFHLLRRGVRELFAPAVSSSDADETVIDHLATLCSKLSRPVQLLLDLAQGSCTPQFKRDLARFARALQPGSCRVVVFGQESSFISMSQAEMQAAGIGAVNMRGFSWEEFLRLVEQHHPGVDKEALWDIFHRLTVGGPAGCPAQLAHALAQQTSLDAMRQISMQAPENMISAAEQNRFGQLPPAAQSAALRLVCFALPFRRQQAEAAFPAESVGAAISALVSLGLLRKDAEGLLEMHEIVRAGLESAIAPAVRQSSHEALAGLYAQEGDIAAQIFHLDRAGRTVDADCLGRETFLQGRSWRSLASYVTRRQLVTVQDIVDVAALPQPVDDFYLLRHVVRDLPGQDSDALFTNLLRQQRNRYFADHQWAQCIVEAILAINPDRFQELLEFTVTQAADAQERREGLAWLQIASHRQRQRATPEVIRFVRVQTREVQHQFLPILMQDGRRDALKLAFLIHARPIDDTARRHSSSWIKLRVEQREDVVEILAALPVRPATQAVAMRSLGFESVGALLWNERQRLRDFCDGILADENEPLPIRTMAWRVLLFIGLPAGRLIDPLVPAPFALDEALLGPVFARGEYDTARFEVHLLDSSAGLKSRLDALLILFTLKADLGHLYVRLTALPQDSVAGMWERMFLILFVRQPFAAGVALLHADLGMQGGALPAQLLAPCLKEVAETDWSGVTDLLLLGLQHAEPPIRSASAWGLARRRAAQAAGALRARLEVEMDPDVVRLIVSALAACGTASADDRVVQSPAPEIIMWQCLVAGRTRQLSFAPRLVALATDTTMPWVVRRAAIWSAARLPFDAALAQIAPSVLAEHAPIAFSEDFRLQVHPAFIDLLQRGVATYVAAGEAKFVEIAAGALTEWRDRLAFPDGAPSPDDAARWLYSHLVGDPSPTGVQRVIDSLRMPLLHSATVRALAICGRVPEIEQVLNQTTSVWLATKCLITLSRMLPCEPGLRSRLNRILAASRCNDVSYLEWLVENLTDRPSPSGTVAGPSTVAGLPVPPSNPLLGFEEASRALRGTPVLFDVALPVALQPLSREGVQRLIAQVDSVQFFAQTTERFTAGMVFTQEGHRVGQTSSTSSNRPSIPALLRPAIAAANRYGLPMQWHDEHLKRPWSGSYAVQFISSLGLQGDADRFYEALEADADILLPALSKPSALAAARGLLGNRLAPVLRRSLMLGDESFFESLCILSRELSHPESLPVLTQLLERWMPLFASSARKSPTENIELWRGFKRLSEHPDFRSIAGWRKAMEDILRIPTARFHAQDIMELLAVDPGSYVLVEEQLAHAEDWVEYSRSEIDWLDAVAEQLFHQTRPGVPLV